MAHAKTRANVVFVCDNTSAPQIDNTNARIVPRFAPVRSMSDPHIGVSTAAVNEPVMRSAPVADPDKLKTSLLTRATRS